MTHNINDLPGHSRRKVNLADLKLSPDLFQPRDRGVDAEHVKALVAALRRGSKFDPLDVWEDQEGNLFLAHGHHRHQAYLQMGRRRADARVYRCSLAEVRLVSIAANAQDRLPTSTSDRSQYAWKLDCEHEGVYSPDLLAQSAGISRRTVYNMRSVREKLTEAGGDILPLWRDAKAAVSTRVWQCSDEEREAIFRERRVRFRERVIGPVGHEARRDPMMVFDVLVEAMGEAVFARAAAERGFHRGDVDQFTDVFSPYIDAPQNPAVRPDAAF